MTHGHRIHKRRYSIRTADGMLREIDAFLDRALVLAEIRTRIMAKRIRSVHNPIVQRGAAHLVAARAKALG